MMEINTSLYFLCRKDYEKYQSLCTAEDMYSMAAKTARFEIVRDRDINLHQLHTLLLMTAHILFCNHQQFKNSPTLKSNYLCAYIHSSV
jgi:hypothetical protein